ncbi:Protein of unknown function [Polaribacter sp. KT25b]|uniref:DUF2971 domain-containing protein n=1 Tax=Polaribacter sp. KT25b TaxID=1855336 RepID=UPI00087BB632|nr:DUF2971 domain-containing protein [Polaribacter sp. KT25b]SDS11631.1 Protein of unknown function [Polaribacter sp. KT25b]
MIELDEIDRIIRKDLLKVLNTNIVYHYSNFEIGVEKIILNNNLKFSSPNEFNDPFDCNEDLLKLRITKESAIKQIKDSKQKLTRNERTRLIKKITNPNTISSQMKETKKDYKLACFSEKSDETLMWSHYSDKHRGICIGFSFPHQYPGKFILCPIKYLEKIEKLDGESEATKVILYWLTTKSERWSYEKEIRAITQSKNTNSYGLIEFERKYVSEIIFGCMVPENDINQTMKKINLNYGENNIIFNKMRINSDTFLLEKITISA